MLCHVHLFNARQFHLRILNRESGDDYLIYFSRLEANKKAAESAELNNAHFSVSIIMISGYGENPKVKSNENAEIIPERLQRITLISISLIPSRYFEPLDFPSFRFKI
jgi:hypothetical protein